MRGAAQPNADELALREREALLSRRHKSAALSFLAGGVAHDLNNLLTVIVGAADLLGEDPLVEEQQRAELLAIQRAGVRATEIARQLLAYSRREPSVPLAFDLADCIGELTPLIARMLGPSVRLELAFGSELWPVRLDPLHAEHVITHLVLNARQAMPQGGVARLSVSNVRVERMERRGHIMVGSGEYVELCVRDTGVGMTATSIARAFEPFFAARDQPASTDLSLPLVRNLVAHALGHIWIESQPGEGTAFRVLFPRYDERRVSSQPPSSRPSSMAPPSSAPPSSEQRSSEQRSSEQTLGIARLVSPVANGKGVRTGARNGTNGKSAASVKSAASATERGTQGASPVKRANGSQNARSAKRANAGSSNAAGSANPARSTNAANAAKRGESSQGGESAQLANAKRANGKRASKPARGQRSRSPSRR